MTNGLQIGQGFQDWINSHDATPESDEMFFSSELSCCMVRISVGGQDTRVLLFYNKMTNEVSPFVQATL